MRCGAFKPISSGSTQVAVVSSDVQTGALGVADTYTFSNVTLSADDILIMWFAMEDSADAGVDNPSGSVSWGSDSWPSGGTNNWDVVRNRTFKAFRTVLGSGQILREPQELTILWLSSTMATTTTSLSVML